MAKKKAKRKTTRVRSLKARDSSKVKGGSVSQEFSMLQSAFSNAIKSIGEGLNTMARKG